MWAPRFNETHIERRFLAAGVRTGIIDDAPSDCKQLCGDGTSAEEEAGRGCHPCDDGLLPEKRA